MAQDSPITLHPAISLNEPNSSDEDNDIILKYTETHAIPLHSLTPSRRLLKLKDDEDAFRDDFVDTDTSVAVMKQATRHTATKHSNRTHMTNVANGATGIHTHTFSKIKQSRLLNPTIVNDKRQKLLLKANIRKLTKLTLEEKSNSRTRIIKKAKHLFRATKLRLRSMMTILFPLARIIRSIEKKFGTGIASFFDLWSSIIYLNGAIFVVAFLLGVLPWFFSSNADMSLLLEWKFYLGLLGVNSEVIGKTWFYYGGYASAEEELRRWNTPMGYAVAVLAYYAISLLLVVYSIGTRLASVTSVDPNMKYSTGVLSMWDHQITSRQSIEALQRAIASRFAEYLRSDENKAAGKKRRNKREWVVFVLRRLTGYVLTLCLLISAPAVVFLVTQYFRVLNDTIPLSTSVIIVTLSVLYPKLLQLAVAIEGYTDAKHANRHNIVRTYVVKLAIATSLVIRVLYPDLLNLELDGDTDSSSKCIGTEAGMVFWQLVIIDFFSAAASNIFANIFLVRVKALVRSQDRKLEFGVSDSVNQVLYRQVLIWIGTALSPMLPLLGIASNLILFFVKYIMCRFTIKFPKNPMANAKSSVFNQAMLLVTLIFSMVPGIAFLLKPDHSCGPFNNISGADVISNFFETNSILTSIQYWKAFWTTVRSPLILYLCIIVLGIMLFFVLQRLRMFRGRWKLELLRVQLERMEKMALAKDQDDDTKKNDAVKRLTSRVGFAEVMERENLKEKLKKQKSKQTVTADLPPETEDKKEEHVPYDAETENYENRMEDERQEQLNQLTHQIQDSTQGGSESNVPEGNEMTLIESEIDIQVEDTIDAPRRRILLHKATRNLIKENYRESQALTEGDSSDGDSMRGSTGSLLTSHNYRESQALTETVFEEDDLITRQDTDR